MLTPPAEVLLSYVTGLAPVGEAFDAPMRQVLADLGYRQKNSFHRYLNELVAAGCVRRLTCGSAGLVGLMVVTRRLEALPARHLPKPPPVVAEPVAHPRAERKAPCQPIPRDRRGMTARVFGDPIFERSALAARVGA